MLNSESRSCGGFAEFSHADYRKAKATLKYWHDKVISNLSNNIYRELFWLAAKQLGYVMSGISLAQLILPLHEQAERVNR